MLRGAWTLCAAALVAGCGPVPAAPIGHGQQALMNGHIDVTARTTSVSGVPQAQAEYGASVALTPFGNAGAVGEPFFDTTAATDAGAAEPFLGAPAYAPLQAAAGAADDHLGTSIAVSSGNTTILAGAPGADTSAGVDAGAVHVFDYGNMGWNEDATIEASDAEAGDGLGIAVALSSDGTFAVVGDWLDDTPAGADAGSVRLFTRESANLPWTEGPTLVASDGAPGDHLGAAVALCADGTRIVAGAPGDETAPGVKTGSARVFALVNGAWIEEATLVPDGAADGAKAGSAVAIDGTGQRVIVGVPGDVTQTYTGTARVFLRDQTTWTEEGVLGVPTGGVATGFGTAVALSSGGRRAVVGAPLASTSGVAHGGAAFVFIQGPDGWTEAVTLVSPNVVAGAGLGASVSMNDTGAEVIAGAPMDGKTLAASGAVYDFIVLGSEGAPCTDTSACVKGAFCMGGACTAQSNGGGRQPIDSPPIDNTGGGCGCSGNQPSGPLTVIVPIGLAMVLFPRRRRRACSRDPGS